MIIECVIIVAMLLLLLLSFWKIPQWQQNVYPPTILLRGNPIALILRDIDPVALRAFLRERSRPSERAWESGNDAPAELRIGKDHYALYGHGLVALGSKRCVEFDEARSILEILANSSASRNELAERAQGVLKLWMWKAERSKTK
jgi:hypothetical protein